MKRYWQALVAAAVFPALAHAADPVPRDEAGFTDYVATQLRAQPLGGDTVTVKGPLTLGVGALQANLQRVYAACRNDAAGCAGEVDHFVRAVAQVAKDRNAPPQQEAVRLAVRPSAYVDQLRATGTHVQTWPLAADLVVVAVLDTPRAMRMLTDADYGKLGLDIDGVWRLGQANLQTTLKPLMEQAPPVGHARIGRVAGDAYDSSRLALHDSWAPLAAAQGGVLIVTAPAKDAVFYIGENTPEAIDALRVFARNMMKQTPAPLSATLLRWTPAGWEPVE